MSALSDSPTAGRTLPFRPRQPIPLDVLVCETAGVTAIMRYWESEADVLACRLCPTCTARRGACTVQTTESVSDGGAALYSSWGLDFGDAGETGRIRPPFGLASG